MTTDNEATARGIVHPEWERVCAISDEEHCCACNKRTAKIKAALDAERERCAKRLEALAEAMLINEVRDRLKKEAAAIRKGAG